MDLNVLHGIRFQERVLRSSEANIFKVSERAMWWSQQKVEVRVVAKKQEQTGKSEIVQRITKRRTKTRKSVSR
jgi:hypothetical protein